MKVAFAVVSLVLGALTSFQALHAASSAQSEFPTKPIRWIIPFPPGGSNDVLGRYLGMKLTERLNHQVVIDNRAGANGIIGAELVAHSAPDGYTLLMISTSFVMNAAVRSKLPYDVDKSFDPIALIGSSPNCIIVNPGLGVNSLKELVERARANPGKFNYAHTGVGGFNHFGGELFNKVAKTNFVAIAYKGGGPAMIDVMAGQVPVMFSSLTQALPNIRSGKLKILGVGADKRSPVMPDTPTVAESGFPGYDVAVWWGVVAPARTSRPVMEILRRELNAVLAQPETQKRLLADAAEPRSMEPADIRKLIRSEMKQWSEVAKEAKIRVE